MKNGKPRTLVRFLSAFLIAALCLPSYAYALRPLNAGGEENPEVTQQVKQALIGTNGDDLLKESLPAFLNVTKNFLDATRLGHVQEAFVEAVTSEKPEEGILGANRFRHAVLYLVRPAKEEERYEILSKIRTLKGDSTAEDWIPASGEKAEALDSPGWELHVKDRRKPPYVDQKLLRKDAVEYARGEIENVREVYYLVLKDDAGRPWGLLMVNNWGEEFRPLFADEGRQGHVKRVLETLGRQALLALENVESSDASKIERAGEELNHRVHDFKNKLQRVILMTERRSLKQKPMGLGSPTRRIARAVDRIKDLSREIMALSRARMDRLRRRQPAPAPEWAVDSSGYEALLHQASLEFLFAVRDGVPEETSRIKNRYLSKAGLPSDVGRVLSDWQRLASSAIVSRSDLREEDVRLDALYKDLTLSYQEIVNLGTRLRDRKVLLQAGVREDMESTMESIRVAGELLQAIGMLLSPSGAVSVQTSMPNRPSRDLQEMLRETVNSFSSLLVSNGNPEIRYNASGIPPDRSVRVSGYDIRLIETAFENLLWNAWNYRNQSRPLQVEVSASFQPGTNWLEVSVRDNGVGIPDGRKQLLFRPGERILRGEIEGRAGSGEGLYGLKARLENRKGSLELVGSEQGKGSEFRFALPLERLDGTVPAEASPVPQQRPAVDPNDPFWAALRKNGVSIEDLLGESQTRISAGMEEGEEKYLWRVLRVLVEQADPRVASALSDPLWKELRADGNDPGRVRKILGKIPWSWRDRILNKLYGLIGLGIGEETALKISEGVDWFQTHLDPKNPRFDIERWVRDLLPDSDGKGHLPVPLAELSLPEFVDLLIRPIEPRFQPSSPLPLPEEFSSAQERQRFFNDVLRQVLIPHGILAYHSHLSGEVVVAPLTPLPVETTPAGRRVPVYLAERPEADVGGFTLGSKAIILSRQGEAALTQMMPGLQAEWSQLEAHLKEKRSIRIQMPNPSDTKAAVSFFRDWARIWAFGRYSAAEALDRLRKDTLVEEKVHSDTLAFGEALLDKPLRQDSPVEELLPVVETILRPEGTLIRRIRQLQRERASSRTLLETLEVILEVEARLTRFKDSPDPPHVLYQVLYNPVLTGVHLEAGRRLQSLLMEKLYPGALLAPDRWDEQKWLGYLLHSVIPYDRFSQVLREAGGSILKEEFLTLAEREAIHPQPWDSAGMEEEAGKGSAWEPRHGSWSPITSVLNKFDPATHRALLEKIDRLLKPQGKEVGALEESELSLTQRYGIPAMMSALLSQFQGNPEIAEKRIGLVLDWAREVVPRLPGGTDLDEVLHETLRYEVPEVSRENPVPEGFIQGLHALESGMRGQNPRGIAAGAEEIFVGTAEPSLDGNNQLYLPAQWKTLRGSKHLAVQLVEKEGYRYLAIYPLTLDSPVLSSGAVIPVRGRGRIRIREGMANWAQVGWPRKVVLLGSGDHLELWNKPEWEKFKAAHDDAFKKVLSDLHAGAEEVRIGEMIVPRAGLEMDGLTVKATGQVAVGLEHYLEPGRPAIVVPAAGQQAITTLGLSGGIREVQASLGEAGVRVRRYETAEQARAAISTERPDLLLVTPEEFALGGWELGVATVVLPAAAAAGLEQPELAALAEAARSRGGILHINDLMRSGAEEQSSFVVLHMT